MTALTDQARELLSGPNTAHLATVMADGTPHSVPLWIGLEGDRIVLFTEPGSLKARNIEREPRVAISLTQADNPYRMAAIRGRVVETIEGDPAFEIVDRISVKFTGKPYFQRSGMVVFAIEPDRVIDMSFDI